LAFITNTLRFKFIRELSQLNTSRPEDDSFADDIARVEKAWDQVMAEVAT
jgi:hypothetical protein